VKLRLLLLILALACALPPLPARASGGSLGVQEFLDGQPGPLKGYREGGRSAAAIIESNSLYYGLSPRLHLALLEATSGLLSSPAPPAAALDQPFGSAGPSGFAAQIEWASRELRAGLGPYSRPPSVRFSDGTSFTLTLNQAPEGVAVQRFLAQGRSPGQWRGAVERFGKAFAQYFNNELVQIGIGGPPGAPGPADPADPGFLLQPWPAGTRMVHLAYFDHVYPTVDSGDDGNSFVVNYMNRGNVQYNGHDGHDYYFPDRPVGTPVLAAAAGMAYPRTHRGNGVVIVHPGGYETVYWHLSGFAPIFSGLIDSEQGVPVRAGDLLGYSGSSGFVRGTPHLHFEVRRFGKQVDPYGWFGPGPDPCAAYAGCLASTWLWGSALRGSYDFTPPGQPPAAAGATASATFSDDTPPVGTLALNPPADLLFAAGFDGHPVQTVGAGFPEIAGALRFSQGHAGQALALGEGGLAYPTAGNLRAAAGTISLWAEIPARYPASGLRRQYLFATSASPDGAPVYSGTLALRRDMLGPGDSPRWAFWTSGADPASADYLAAPDTLAPGWHHFAVSWDAASGSKALAIDGVDVARESGVALPTELGVVLQLGRFTYGGAPAGIAVDDLAIFGRALAPAELASLPAAPPADAQAIVSTSRQIRLDTNAIDREGGIVAVQLGVDGIFADPQPYYDAYRWQLAVDEGAHSLAVRYFDRGGNSTTVTRTLTLDLPPRASAVLEPTGALGVTALISATDSSGPISMQLSQRPDFADAAWQPLSARVFWAWQPGRPRRLYLRLRDANGNLSAARPLGFPPQRIYLPQLSR
jgi:murein DD-endopeptidase MepM/ murein hydrolase activator NlpD